MTRDETDSGEIQFHAGGPQAGKEAPCPVCGESVGAAPTRCPQCDTPHHFDCWEYNSGCGVYGCSSKPKQAARPQADENTVALPGKLGLPHKRAGSYAGVWWVPPIAGAMSVALEFVAIGALAAGSTLTGISALLAMVSCLLWIAFSSVHYYLDFEKLRVSKAKSVLGTDLVEWGVANLSSFSHLEVQRIATSLSDLMEETAGSRDSASLAWRQYRVVAVWKNSWLPPLEIAPAMAWGSEGLTEVADLFRRIEAAHAFPVKMDHEVRTLPPPARNSLLLEGGKGGGTPG